MQFFILLYVNIMDHLIIEFNRLCAKGCVSDIISFLHKNNNLNEYILFQAFIHSIVILKYDISKCIYDYAYYKNIIFKSDLYKLCISSIMCYAKDQVIIRYLWNIHKHKSNNSIIKYISLNYRHYLKDDVILIYKNIKIETYITNTHMYIIFNNNIVNSSNMKNEYINIDYIITIH